MFKGSKNVQPEAHTSMLASVGGQSNAYTTDDETVFWETVPAQYLPLDPLARGRSDGDAADRQGHVHQRARRREGRAADARRQPALRAAERDHLRPGVHACTPTSTRRSAACRISKRRRSTTCAISIETYYVPANATLVLVGDFDSAQALQLVSQYLGRVPKAERPVPRDIPQEPPQTKEKRVDAAAAVAAAGGRRRLPRHQRRQPRLLSAAHRGEGAVRRPDVADLPEAGLRKADGGRRVRQRQPDRASEPVLRGRDRAAGQIARRSRPTR